MESKTASAARQPYTRPRLVVYGDLRDLTQSDSTNAMNDKGSGSITMT